MEHPLYKHQEEFLKDPPNKALLHWDTGTGKTRAAIEWAMKKQEDGRTTLFIVPKQVREKWLRDIAQWAYQAKEFSFMVLTKEEFYREFRHDHLVVGKFDSVVVDEAHYFAGMKSNLTKMLRKFMKVHDIKKRLLLTATAYMSTPWNIYVIANHLGCNWSYMAFKDKFFFEISLTRPDGKKGREILKPREGIEDEIAELVQKLGSVVHIEDCAEVPEQKYITEHLELLPGQQHAIDELDYDIPIVTNTKEHQIENGVLKGNEYEPDRFFDNKKTSYILELVSRHKKIAIICRYNQQVDFMKNSLLVSTHRKILIINGSVKYKDPVVQEAEKLDDVIVIINAACSEGYQLPSIGVCVFASNDYSYKNYKQMKGRFLRLDKLKVNTYIHLITKRKDSIDQAVFDSVAKKKNFSMAIYSKNKIINK